MVSFCVAMVASISALPCSVLRALRMPNATADSYNVWYAMMLIRISSRTRRSNNPRSAQFTVVWRMSSSKHCA